MMISKNRTKLLRILRSNKNISESFLNTVLQDHSMPSAIKRRVYLYSKRDKRLSVEKLIKDLKDMKVAPYQASGGGWCLGRKKDCNYNLFVVRENEEKKKLEVEHVKHEEHVVQNERVAQDAMKTALCSLLKTKNCENIEEIGKGAFASVFSYNNEYAYKVFTDPESYGEATNNINSFIEYIQNREYTILNSDYANLSKIGTNSLFGIHRLTLCDGDLRNNFNVVLLRKAFSNLMELKLNENINFIHNDIKIENILYKNTDVYISDFDGVYVYEDAFPVPDRMIHFTPFAIHPLMLLYNICAVDAHKQLNGDVDIDQIILLMKTRIHHETLDHFAVWKTFFAHINAEEEKKIYIYQKVQNMLNLMCNNNYIGTIKYIFENENNENNETIKQGLQTIIPYFDIYSLGMSIYFRSLFEENKNAEIQFLCIEILDLFRRLFSVAFQTSYTIEGGIPQAFAPKASARLFARPGSAYPGFARQGSAHTVNLTQQTQQAQQTLQALQTQQKPSKPIHKLYESVITSKRLSEDQNVISSFKILFDEIFLDEIFLDEDFYNKLCESVYVNFVKKIDNPNNTYI